MPKRVLDFDALWASDKIASCPGWAQAEYAWLYGLADASGCFELTNLRVIWGRVAAVRKDLTLERLEEIFQEFMARGLLFTWQCNGKRYGHWTGSDVPGRLPAPSWRARLERLAPPVPREELAAYVSQFASRRALEVVEASAATVAPLAPAIAQQYVASNSGTASNDNITSNDKHDEVRRAEASPEVEAADPDSMQLSLGLKLGLEATQGQEWDRDWKEEKGLEETPRCVPAALPSESANFIQRGLPFVPQRKQQPGTVVCSGLQVEPAPVERTNRREPGQRHVAAATEFLEIYERERGGLPGAAALTPERIRQCAQRIRAGLKAEEFGAAVKRAAATPFLAGDGARGWRANFDWFIANDTNVRKVTEGVYESAQTRTPTQTGFFTRPSERALYSEIHVGAGPIAEHSGARIRPEAVERMRARAAARCPP